MRPHLFVVLSLSLFAACTDMSVEEEDTARPEVGLSNARLPTRLQLSQPEAATQCQPYEHLATSAEMTLVLGQCHATSLGYQCNPLDNDSLAQLKGLSFDGVWTSTVCARGDHSPGFFVANLETGEISCLPTSAAAQPICLH